PGGVLSLTWWPTRVEDEGPFAVSFELLTGLGLLTPRPELEDVVRLLGAVGLEVLEATRITHEMRHGSADEVWHGMSEGGSWRCLRARAGDAVMEQLRQALLTAAPGGQP